MKAETNHLHDGMNSNSRAYCKVAARSQVMLQLYPETDRSNRQSIRGPHARVGMASQGRGRLEQASSLYEGWCRKFDNLVLGSPHTVLHGRSAEQ